jgi:2-keto-4-pentenoate hydratase/2-oxohepta-3-ene-1,7-dioic acid hydratase in catechol pathway
MHALYEQWDMFREWATAGRIAAAAPQAAAVEPARVGPPVPRPPQVFAIGLNYKAHAAEANLELPSQPMVFTKYPAAIAGPFDAIGIPAGKVDWEVELVAVIGRRAERVAAGQAWDYVAGLTLGQDISERVLQTTSSVPPQYNLGKSYKGFAPIGPVLVTPDDFDNPDDIAISCELNGETMQRGRTSDTVFTVAELIEYLSRVLPLLPGDLIFTGTPAGIGAARRPQVFIGPDDILTTSAEGIGTMRNTFFPLD